MSELQALKQKRSKLEKDLDESRSKLEHWQGELSQAKSELKNAMLEGDATYKKATRVTEAEMGVETFSERVAELERKLKVVTRAVAEADYDEGWSELADERSDTIREMEENIGDLVDYAEEAFARQEHLVADFNQNANTFNMTVANRIGKSGFDYITALNGLSPFDWVVVVLRERVAEGRLS